MSDELAAQYEAYPYPARDPAHERERLIVGSPSHVLEIDHYLFAGRRDFGRPFRVLFAGGGSGDGCIMLAQQLADIGAAAEIIHLDLSTASSAIARARAAARGLGAIRFEVGSLLDAVDLGRFDYIDCCGVLHHLADPTAGLRALERALDDDGGMGVMVYGRDGRTGVYPAQAALRLLAGADTALAARVDLARRYLKALPEGNWLKRNSRLGDHLGGGDAGIVDLLLHVRDRAFTVPEIAEMTAAAGMRITAFIEPAAYDPANYLKDAALRKRAAALSWIDGCALAELVAGTMERHVFYLAKAGNSADTVARADAADAVPVLREHDAQALAGGIKPGGTVRADFGGAAMRFPIPALGPAIIALIDGRRDLAAIHAALDAQLAGGIAWNKFKTAFDSLYASLNPMNVLLLSRSAEAS